MRCRDELHQKCAKVGERLAAGQVRSGSQTYFGLQYAEAVQPWRSSVVSLLSGSRAQVPDLRARR
jgi:hypothetical protein